MVKTSFIILIHKAQDRLNETLDSIFTRGERQTQVICLVDDAHYGSIKKARIDDYPCVSLIKSDFASRGAAEALNAGISLAEGNVIFFVTEPVILLPGFMNRYTDKINSGENTGYVYGNFYTETTAGGILAEKSKIDRYDYAESSVTGPVRGMKTNALNTAGRYDESLKFALEYDLRLRICERYGIAHVEEYLYKCLDSSEDSGTKDLTHPSCSYLYYSPDEEREYRETCFNSLKRRGAFLTRAPQSVQCPDESADGPQISVIIPLYNRAQYIGRTIKSVLNNEWKRFEIIVVDNGSTDGSYEAAEGYLGEGNILLLRNNINNTAGALNLGLKHARGKYVCQLDSDDLYTPETLGTLYSYMESNPGFALGVSYYDCIGPDDRSLTEYGVIKHEEYDRNNLIRTDGIGAARIWHRCVLEEFNGFDEDDLGSYGEDYDLALKLSEKYGVLRIPHVLYRYRINHKRTDEITEYAIRHAKKTYARESAVRRRQKINERLRETA